VGGLCVGTCMALVPTQLLRGNYAERLLYCMADVNPSQMLDGIPHPPSSYKHTFPWRLTRRADASMLGKPEGLTRDLPGRPAAR
jgi:hypothetical protein